MKTPVAVYFSTDDVRRLTAAAESALACFIQLRDREKLWNLWIYDPAAVDLYYAAVDDLAFALQDTGLCFSVTWIKPTPHSSIGTEAFGIMAACAIEDLREIVKFRIGVDCDHTSTKLRERIKANSGCRPVHCLHRTAIKGGYHPSRDPDLDPLAGNLVDCLQDVTTRLRLAVDQIGAMDKPDDWNQFEGLSKTGRNEVAILPGPSTPRKASPAPVRLRKRLPRPPRILATEEITPENDLPVLNDEKADLPSSPFAEGKIERTDGVSTDTARSPAPPPAEANGTPPAGPADRRDSGMGGVDVKHADATPSKTTNKGNTNKKKRDGRQSRRVEVYIKAQLENYHETLESGEIPPPLETQADIARQLKVSESVVSRVAKELKYKHIKNAKSDMVKGWKSRDGWIEAADR